jgi:hypothetical protein
VVAVVEVTEVVTVTDVLVDVLSPGTVLDVVEVLVVLAPGHSLVSITVQLSTQLRKAPVELPGHVAPPKSQGSMPQSQTSPVSITPFPQSEDIVDDVVLVTDVEVVLSPPGVVVDVVLSGGVVVVVLAPGHSLASISVQPAMQFKKAPVELPGHVAPPKSQPSMPQSQTSPASITPFPQSGDTVDEVVVVTVVDDTGGSVVVVVVTVVLVTGGTVVLLVSKQLLKSMVQVFGSQSRNAPSADPGGHDAPPKSSPSHSSPGSFTSLPHSGVTSGDVGVQAQLRQVCPAAQPLPSHCSPAAASTVPSPHTDGAESNSIAALPRGFNLPQRCAHAGSSIARMRTRPLKPLHDDQVATTRIHRFVGLSFTAVVEHPVREIDGGLIAIMLG